MSTQVSGTPTDLNINPNEPNHYGCPPHSLGGEKGFQPAGAELGNFVHEATEGGGFLPLHWFLSLVAYSLSQTAIVVT
jgi:hypothetical protein